jgi:hypothetical protein
MGATYAVGTAGVATGRSTLHNQLPTIALACLLTVGDGGVFDFPLSV